MKTTNPLVQIKKICNSNICADCKFNVIENNMFICFLKEPVWRWDIKAIMKILKSRKGNK